MLNCHGCGLTSRPYEAVCALCDHPLQDEAVAQAKRLEWDALPPNLAVRPQRWEKIIEKLAAVASTTGQVIDEH